MSELPREKKKSISSKKDGDKKSVSSKKDVKEADKSSTKSKRPKKEDSNIHHERE